MFSFARRTPAAVRNRLLPAACFLLTACASHAPSPDERRTAVVIAGTTIVDVERGALIADQSVIISDGIIKAIGPSATTTVPRGARVRDGSGGYLIPGLVDMHAHPFGEGAFAGPGHPPTFGPDILGSYLHHGITTIRVMSGSPRSLAARARVAAGELRGPRMIVCGPPVVTRRMPRAVTSAAGARREVALQHEAGYDCIKIYARFSPANRDVHDALLGEAATRGLAVAGHVQFDLPPREAFRMRTIEHLEQLPRYFEGPQVTAASRDSALTALRASGTFVTPTIGMHSIHRYIDPAVLAARLAQPDVRMIPREVYDRELEAIAAGTHYLQDSAEARSQREFMERALRTTRLLHEAGVPLLAGSDAGGIFLHMPGRSLHEELSFLVEAGLSPLDALRAATINAARALGEEERRGSVAVGKVADLVLLEGSPLADVTNIQRIRWVMAVPRR